MSALTPKQEKFCQNIVTGMSQADAYRKSYNAGKMKPATVQKRASELIAGREISGRVEELRIPVIENCRITMENHLKELQELREHAKASGQTAAAIKAEELRGKVCGLYTEKIEHSGSLDIRMLLDEIESDEDPLINE